MGENGEGRELDKGKNHSPGKIEFPPHQVQEGGRKERSDSCVGASEPPMFQGQEGRGGGKKGSREGKRGGRTHFVLANIREHAQKSREKKRRENLLRSKLLQFQSGREKRGRGKVRDEKV